MPQRKESNENQTPKHKGGEGRRRRNEKSLPSGIIRTMALHMIGSPTKFEYPTFLMENTMILPI